MLSCQIQQILCSQIGSVNGVYWVLLVLDGASSASQVIDLMDSGQVRKGKLNVMASGH